MTVRKKRTQALLVAAGAVLLLAMACTGSASGDFPRENADPRVGDLSAGARERLDELRAHPEYERRWDAMIGCIRARGYVDYVGDGSPVTLLDGSISRGGRPGQIVARSTAEAALVDAVSHCSAASGFDELRGAPVGVTNGRAPTAEEKADISQQGRELYECLVGDGWELSEPVEIHGVLSQGPEFAALLGDQDFRVAVSACAAAVR